MKDNLARLAPAIVRELHEAGARRERKELEEQLRQAQKMEAIGRLAGGMAHDFNNLLTVIPATASCSSAGSGRRPASRARSSEIHKAGDRAAALTRQLLAFSRKQVLAPKVLDLNARRRASSSRCCRRLHRRGHRAR